MARPSKYKPEYCEEAISFMADGYSVTALAGHLGVARSTVFKWAEDNDKFSDALKTGQALAALWWEKALRTVASTGEGNASAAIFGVKNRSNEDWRDKQEHEHTGKDGGPIQTEDVTALDDIERAKRLNAILERARARRDGSTANGGDADMDSSSGAAN